jgi:hypothetical protein
MNATRGHWGVSRQEQLRRGISNYNDALPCIQQASWRVVHGFAVVHEQGVYFVVYYYETYTPNSGSCHDLLYMKDVFMVDLLSS